MNRFQGRVAVSRWALPLAAVYGALVWLGAGLVTMKLWLPFALMALCTYLMAELNNRNTLLRIRSRMVSFSFIMLSAMNIHYLSDWRVALVQLCLACFLIFTFASYQNDSSPGIAFVAFLCLGVASVAWVQMLYFYPVLLLLCARPLYSFSLKTFSATLLGIVMPYWLLLPYYFYVGRIETLPDHFLPLADFSMVLSPAGITYGAVTVWSFLVLFMFTGMIHFLRRAYNDKIRVRALYWVLIILSLLFMGLSVVVPQYANYLIPMAEVTISPLIAHFIVFTRTKVTNWAFILGLLLVICVMAFQLCLTSLYNTVL